MMFNFYTYDLIYRRLDKLESMTMFHYNKDWDKRSLHKQVGTHRQWLCSIIIRIETEIIELEGLGVMMSMTMFHYNKDWDAITTTIPPQINRSMTMFHYNKDWDHLYKQHRRFSYVSMTMFHYNKDWDRHVKT